MPEAQLKAFIEAVEADVGLQKKLAAAADANHIVEIAKAAGFVVSAEMLQKAQTELSDEELEGATGGNAVANFYNDYLNPVNAFIRFPQKLESALEFGKSLLPMTKSQEKEQAKQALARAAEVVQSQAGLDT